MSKHRAGTRRPYPDRALVAGVLAEAATGVALESGLDHPEDIACQMLNAIEGGAVVIEILWKRGAL